MKMKSESEVAQSCPALSDPRDCSLPGSSVHGIFQARVLQWGAIAFSDSSLKCSVNRSLLLWLAAVKIAFPTSLRGRSGTVSAKGCVGWEKKSVLPGVFFIVFPSA